MSTASQPDRPVAKPAPIRSESLLRFRREAWWQVTFPVIVAALLAVAGVVLTIVLGGPAGASVVADYSLVLLIILNLIGGLITLAIFAGLAYAVTALLRATPPYTNAAQQFVDRIYRWIDHQTDRLAHVVIVVRSTLVGLSSYLRRRGIIPEDEPEQPPAGDS